MRDASLAPVLAEKCVNTIRMLAVDAIEKANSGHPGMPMGSADFAFVLWNQHLRYSASRPDWFNRDRFVLSAGHISMLLYAMIHLSGYDLSLEEIKDFRQWGSKTPGHPEYEATPGVETTTGPLGQGCMIAAGMAMAAASLEPASSVSGSAEGSGVCVAATSLGSFASTCCGMSCVSVGNTFSTSAVPSS